MHELENYFNSFSNLIKNINEEIKKVLQKSDQDAYNKWREDGFNVNHLFYEKYTLLHLATCNGSTEMMTALIKKGANVNAIACRELTPLHVASRCGQIEAIKVLVKNGADINAATESGYTPLHKAIYYAKRELTTEVVKVLIENGANVNATLRSCRMTPLHLAAGSESNIGTVRILLENRANVNALNIYNTTPLHISAISGCLEIVKVLIENGANVNAENNDGGTPLHAAIYYAPRELTDIVKVLIESGANVNTALRESRTTPLHVAARSESNIGTVRILLENRANVKALDIHKRTPLHYAARFGCIKIAKNLILKWCNG